MWKDGLDSLTLTGHMRGKMNRGKREYLMQQTYHFHKISKRKHRKVWRAIYSTSSREKAHKN